MPEYTEPGFFSGKAGIMIYLFRLARQTNNVWYQELAEQMIDEVCLAADKIKSANFDNGLCGLAWAVEYLAQEGFIEANTEDVLEDINNKIFKLVSSKSFDELVAISDMLPGIAFYLIRNIKPRNDDNSESVCLKKDLLILIINAIETKYNKDSYIKLKEEPVRFSLTEYKLPFYLYLIAELYGLNFYNYKLDRIIDSINPIILSVFPLQQSHRIYFIFALKNLMKYVQFTKWELHLALLVKSIDVNALLQNEFHNKSISLNYGMSGLLFLLGVFPNANQFQFSDPIQHGLIKKIYKSDYFEKKQYMKDDISLLLGKTGIALSLLIHNILPDNKDVEKTADEI